MINSSLPAPYRQAPLASPETPTSQDYAEAIRRLYGQPDIRTPGALASNLLAEAINRYGQSRSARPAPQGVDSVGMGVASPDQDPDVAVAISGAGGLASFAPALGPARGVTWPYASDPVSGR